MWPAGWWHPWLWCRGDAAGRENHQVHRPSVVGAPEGQVRKGHPWLSLSMASGPAGCCPHAGPPCPGGWDGPAAPTDYPCPAPAAGWGVGRARAPCRGQCSLRGPLLPRTGAAGARAALNKSVWGFFLAWQCVRLWGGCSRAGGATPPPHLRGCAASGALRLLGGVRARKAPGRAQGKGAPSGSLVQI